MRIGGDISQEEVDAILTGGLPESRTVKRRFFQGPLGWMERVYCANCGRARSWRGQGASRSVEEPFDLMGFLGVALPG